MDRIPRVLCPDNPVHATAPLVSVDPDLVKLLLKSCGGRRSIRKNSVAYKLCMKSDIKRDEHDDCRPFMVYATRGNVRPHKDHFGQSFGLVLLADGKQKLCVEGGSANLKTGSVFHLNTNHNHWTICDDPNAVLIFMAMDWGMIRKEPVTLPYQTFANSAMRALIEYKNAK